jgi:hypothetical protein
MTKKEEEKKILKKEAVNAVRVKMLNLVECLWVSSDEFESRPKKDKCVEPKPATKIALVKKAAKMLKKTYEYGRDVVGYDKEHYKYQLVEIENYIVKPLDMYFSDFWDGMAEADEEPHEEDAYRAARKGKDSWLTK